MKLISWRFFKFMPDKLYIRLKYFTTFKKRINLKNPVTFNEKIQWLKINDRKKEYSNYVDKYESKRIVSKLIGKKYIIPTIGIFENLDLIDFESLPNQYVIKCTHDCGSLVIVKNKKEVNIDIIKEKINKGLKNNYYYSSREWPYKNVKPRIIIEKYMGENLEDYKIFCFNGIPKIILVCSNRKGFFKNTNFYDTNWNLLPFTRENHSNNPIEQKKPSNLSDMLDIAKKLSKGFDFMRVDLYNIDENIYFGEMTFYPSSGFEGFEPKEYDKILGEMINLSD